MYRVSLTRVSSNAKTGPIPVSTTASGTCPKTCGTYDTCYAKYGPLAIHWKAVDAGTRGGTWDEFCEEVRRLPKGQLWRHNQAGDLPGNGERIDAPALFKLVQANVGKRGFTYTHYPLMPTNAAAIAFANSAGFTINLSCDTMGQCDKMRAEYDLPLVVLLPSSTDTKTLHTPAGHKVVVCPATYRDDTSCANCGICAEAGDRAIIGFPAHGSKRRTIDIRLDTT